MGLTVDKLAEGRLLMEGLHCHTASLLIIMTLYTL